MKSQHATLSAALPLTAAVVICWVSVVGGHAVSTRLSDLVQLVPGIAAVDGLKDRVQALETSLAAFTQKWTESIGELPAKVGVDPLADRVEALETSVAALKTAGRSMYIEGIEDWHNKSCSNDSDCHFDVAASQLWMDQQLHQPICYAGQCVCHPDNFYSVGLKHCVSQCSEEDLMDTFTPYINSGIYGHNNFEEETNDHDVCKAKCINDWEGCKNVEILQTCYGSRSSPGEAGVSFSFGASRPWTYYQRNCK